ncbi:MYXO-CTERM sorting domain-containing protein [Nannocystis radixulma]|uniref:Chondroitinase-B domain-containing protein n=1 Tax=Nannocystis radixulma TaxID=2995305 RepID=A0ABT5BNP7_9BACT|nr:chondroitinase-B domain-containing protein [Nannocystis radixulma]MDC0675763.1 chondroitinase-B domain-containing protein [Nannocystis radixulma]
MRTLPLVTATALTLAAAPALAADNLTIQETLLDRPTLVALGVQVLIADDDDRDARIDVRYRVAGAAEWRVGAPLFRVKPEKVELPVPQQFAGSVLDLLPGTTYEIELHAVDADGLDETWTVMGTTREVPGDPAAPNVIQVSDAGQLADALGAAEPGDVIELADGTYAGTWAIDSSGTAEDPIVVRGASTAGTILDGEGAGGNILEVYGSHVHVERMTLRNANRAIRFQTAGAEGNVVRRVHIEAVNLGIGAREDQLDFYICDNTLNGPLEWPYVYSDDGGVSANVDGIVVYGHGHVVCHNELVGWGDALKTHQDGARAIDFYGNITRSAYDNAIELDGSAGNTRAMRNLLLNSYSPLSFQPIFGGPAYAIRNVVVNVTDEQTKLHANSDTGETVGAIIVHNTFVSPNRANEVHTTDTAHDFKLLNNLYVTGAEPEGGKTVDLTCPISDAEIDYNGYWPDGQFDFGAAGDWPDFAAMQAAGVFEAHGTLLTADTFASGLTAPASYMQVVTEADVALSQSSPAIDAGLALPGWMGGIEGAGPDLGALEFGCDAPHYGPRPEGVDESTPPPACGDSGGDTTSGETTEGDTTDGPDPSGGPTGGPGDPTDGPDPTEGTDPTGSGSGPTTLPTTGDDPTGGDPSGGVATDGTGDPGATGGSEPSGEGCGCRATSRPPGFMLLVLLAFARRRRR